MKHNYLMTLLLFVLASNAYAQRVSLQVARQKAETFMSAKGIPVEKGIARAQLSSAIADKAPLYVFNSKEGKGFVIISGDERTEDVLGYGLEGEFDETRIPENMKNWLESCSEEIAALGEEEGAQPAKVGTHPVLGNLVTAMWDQGEATSTGEVYNTLCPTIDGKYCITGCVATALAMVMRYHKWPEGYTTAIPAYESNETLGQLAALPKVKFDWNNMQDRYDAGQTDSQIKAVAQLMRYCGQGVMMDYGHDASSAYTNDVVLALRTYFGYDVNTRFERKSDYSAQGWDNLIYNELKNGRPVVYSGSNPGGGHAFVCDGYDGQGYYHINWGWSGHYNGYFKLSILNPKGGGSGSSTSNCGYSMTQGAVVGIQKPTGETGERRTLSVLDFSCEGHTLNAQYVNRTGMDGTFLYGFAYQLADANSNSYKVRRESIFLEPFYSITYSLDLDEMSLDDGVYNFYPYSILDGCSWYRVLCDRNKYYQVEFSGKQVKSISYHPRASLVINSLECVGNKIVNQPQEVAITVGNNGEEYGDVFYLFASKTNDKGEAVDQICLPVEVGATEQSSLFFTPTSTGKWKLWIDIVEDGSNDVGPWEVDIVNPPTSDSNLSVVSAQIDSSTDAVFKVKVKNNSSEGYYMPIICYIFEKGKTYNISYDKTSYLNLGPKKTIDLEFRFESLKMGQTYTVALKAYTNHNSSTTEWISDNYSFVVNSQADPVGIDVPVVEEPAIFDVYTMSGVLVRRQASSLEGLPKGVYIVDGKKMVVR
ncbi:MAG: C10 family peptidase [Prevotella sp.]|nr:C10 family peptidase [Prevotella sp.]